MPRLDQSGAVVAEQRAELAKVLLLQAIPVACHPLRSVGIVASEAKCEDMAAIRSNLAVARLDRGIGQSPVPDVGSRIAIDVHAFEQSWNEREPPLLVMHSTV